MHNDERDIFCVPDYPISLPRYAGYEAGSCALSPLPIQSDYHRPCPSIDSAVNPRSVSAVPLTAGSHTEDNRVQSSPQVDAFSAGVFGRVVLLDNWLYLVPQFVWHLPNCWQRFKFLFFLGHLRLLSFRVHRWLSAKLCVLR